MPVPNTSTFSLQNVVNEIAGAQSSLSDCFFDANPDGFNPSYEGLKNSLLNFRDYDDDDGGGVPTTSVTLGTSSSNAVGACQNYIFSPVTYYIPLGQTFPFATALYINSSGTTTAPSRWYSDGSNAKYWNGSSFTSNMLCTL
tara:strand:+ start:567 stop:992 length:426 start_codon:yes stop_codon:yes gene_type:complete